MRAALIPAPFDTLAESYDRIFTESAIGSAQRSLVWEEADRLFQPGQRLLELNCGTGVDAVHLAERGIEVVACDAAEKMIAIARRRVEAAGLDRRVDLRVVATEGVEGLLSDGPFDGFFSNFAGLNCVEDIEKAGRDLSRLLKPGAKALVCMFGTHCLWEVLSSLARADFRKAFRRFHNSSKAKLGRNASIKVRYYSIRKIEGAFAPYFSLRRWRGVGIAVPPSYLEPLATRFPTCFRAAEKTDVWLGRAPLLRGFADHILLTFERSES
jgi:ubiquinone/menaquinone biosynthesis C-methylase UbiE